MAASADRRRWRETPYKTVLVENEHEPWRTWPEDGLAVSLSANLCRRGQSKPDEPPE